MDSEARPVRQKLIKKAILAFLTFFAFCALVGAAGFQVLVRQTAVISQVESEILKNPIIVEKIGRSNIKGWISGSFSETHQGETLVEGQADLEIPVEGDLGTGSLCVAAKVHEGKWKYEKLLFTLDRETYDLQSSGKSQQQCR